jgi:hypothetical protein
VGISAANARRHNKDYSLILTLPAAGPCIHTPGTDSSNGFPSQ